MASNSLLPNARYSRRLHPSEAMRQATRSASDAPWRRNDSKIASWTCNRTVHRHARIEQLAAAQLPLSGK